MREYRSPLPKTPQAWDGAFYGKVWPGHAGYDVTRSWWELPENDVPAMGPVLREFLVDGVAPMLVSSLNRDILLRWDADRTLMPETVDWHATGPGRLGLIADTATSEQIDAEIERMRAMPYVNPDWLIANFSYLADRYPDRYSYLRQDIEQLRARRGVAWPSTGSCLHNWRQPARRTSPPRGATNGPHGSVPRSELAQLVPAAAWRLLEELEGDEYGDDYQYEWIAQLFYELGLQDAVPELAERALTSSDPAVRSMGEWIREEFRAR
jgi:hypothetical protein